MREDQANESFLGCEAGGATYAIPIRAVKEVILPTKLLPLPGVASELVGIIDHRRRVVPIVDLATLISGTAASPSSRQKWILLELPGRTVGLIVEHVSEVFASQSKEAGARSSPVNVLPAGDGALATPRPLPLVSRVSNRHGKLMLVLDLEGLSAVFETYRIPEVVGR